MLCLSIVAVLIPVLLGTGGSDDPSPEPQVITGWSPYPATAGEDLACANDSDSLACLYGQGLLNASAPAATIAAATAAAADVTPEALAAAAAGPEPEPEPWPTMELRPGDTLYALAEWFGVSAWDIAVANGASIDDIFQIGQVIAIPVPSWEFVLPPEPTQAALARSVEEPEPVYVAPAPTPLPYYYTGSTDDVIAAICSLPWPCDTMVRIASCESGLNPNSMNPAGYYGLFQINFMFDGWNDPWRNAQVAYETKYLPALNAGGDGLSPWPACRYY